MSVEVEGTEGLLRRNAAVLRASAGRRPRRAARGDTNDIVRARVQFRRAIRALAHAGGSAGHSRSTGRFADVCPSGFGSSGSSGEAAPRAQGGVAFARNGTYTQPGSVSPIPADSRPRTVTHVGAECYSISSLSLSLLPSPPVRRAKCQASRVTMG